MGGKSKKMQKQPTQKRGRGENIQIVKGTQGAGSSEQAGKLQVEGAALVEMEMEGWERAERMYVWELWV